MIGTILFFAVLALAPPFAAWRAEGGSQRVGFTSAVVFGALAFGVLLAVANDRVPFLSGGDDYAYYRDSLRELGSAADWFRFGQIHGYEQGGYPLLLLWVQQVAGDSLFVRKALNLAFYLLLAVVWYSIGSRLGGRRTAFTFGLAILLATPLWFYWAFLLKDMTVILLQSLFLMGVVRVVTRAATPGTWLLLVASTLVLVPLRIYMVLVNVAVLAVSVVLVGKQSVLRKAGLTLAVGGVVALFASVGTSEAALRALGVRGTRLLQYQAVAELSGQFMEDRDQFVGPLRTALYPFLFVIGETTGLRPDAASAMPGLADATPLRIRGALGLPWIFLGPPLLAAGVWVRVRHVRFPEEAEPGEQPHGWLPLFAFLAMYLVIAWIVEDTVRWRMPAFPVMVAVAAQGWLWLSPGRRGVLVLGWTTAVVLLATAYYTLLK